MMNVSQGFKDAVVATSRQADARVTFEILDVTANTDATATSTSDGAFSQKSQLFNQNRQMSNKYATFENNFFKLDGGFVLPPTASELTSYETGWWSNILCGADGTFSPAQVITCNFTMDHSSIGLTITFDPLANEYASDFTIQFYNSSSTLIQTNTVTANTQASYILYQNVSNYRKVVITITKWATPYRRARVTEIDFGVIETYSGSTLTGMSIIEDIDTTSNTVSTNELKFSVDNSDNRFNIINPSGVYPYLQRRQKLKPYFGIVKADNSTEYVQMGTYYLTEWKSDEGTLTASFVARDMLDMLSQTIYRKGKVQSRSLYNLAVDVLTDAGVTDYSIDTALQTITVGGNIPLVTHREALQYISMAGLAVCTCDRSGKIIIKQLLNTPLTETIDFDNVYSSPSIKLDKLVNTVDVNVNAYVAKGASENIFSGIIAVTGTQNIWIEYKSAPAQSVSASVTGGTLNSATYFGNAAQLNITASGNVTVSLTGTVLESSSSLYSLRDATAPSTEQTLSVKCDNPLITDTTTASNLANFILGEYQKRFLYEINWRQNPALECGDIVTVEDEFGADKTMRITSQEFDFEGFLSGKTNGKGAGL